MLKRVLLFAIITFSLVDAQFISSPSVLQRAEKFLQRYTESSDSTYTVYEVKGNIKLPMKVDVPIENFGGRYIINLNSGTRNIRVNDFEEFNLRKIASEDLRNYFNNEVLNSSKITRVAFEHQQRNGQSEIVGGIVMFHQLVQNVIVRGDAFIFLYYDALSNLKKIEYSWLNVKKKIAKRIKMKTPYMNSVCLDCFRLLYALIGKGFTSIRFESKDCIFYFLLMLFNSIYIYSS